MMGHSRTMTGFKFSRTSLLLSALMIAACRAPTPDYAAHIDKGLDAWLDCLPSDAAILAAHRGTHRGSQYPENSLSGLTALIERGMLIVEIDVAQTRDGVAILYHDGVWEEGSNGRGAVAATNWETVQTFSLRDTNGRLREDGIPTLEDYLASTKGQTFLEIDFKSSSDYSQVIEIIQNNDLINQVILIAYNAGQARALRRLAPDAYISLPADDVDAIDGPKLAWLGGQVRDTSVPAIVRISDNRNNMMRNRDLIRTGAIAVTDYALSEQPIVGLADLDAFTACLAGN